MFMIFMGCGGVMLQAIFAGLIAELYRGLKGN